MDNRELVAALVDSLAWPVMVSVVAIVFRRQIRDLFARGLTRLKVGPVEASWAAAERLIPPEVRSHRPTAPPDPGLTQTAAVSPRVAILERHDELISRTISEAAARGFDSRDHRVRLPSRHTTLDSSMRPRRARCSD